MNEPGLFPDDPSVIEFNQRLDAFQAETKSKSYRRIIEFFRSKRGSWISIIDLAQALGSPVNVDHSHNRFFCGLQWDRRLREVREKGLLESEPDPNAKNRTHRWRLP